MNTGFDIDINTIITGMASAGLVGGFGLFVIKGFFSDLKATIHRSEKNEQSIDILKDRLSAVEEKMKSHDDLKDEIIRMTERMRTLISKIDVLETWLMTVVGKGQKQNG